MNQITLKGIVFLVVFSFSQLASAISYTVDVPKKIIEQQIALHMPLEKKVLMTTLRLSEPRLTFLEESNEIALFLNVDVFMIEGMKGSGRGELVGTIDYRAEEGAFYIVNPRIVDLSIDRVPSFLFPRIARAAELLLARSLVTYPVYRLNEEDVRHKMAKSALKKVTVTTETLQLTLGMF